MPAPEKRHTQFNLAPLRDEQNSVHSPDNPASEPTRQADSTPRRQRGKRNGPSVDESPRKLLKGRPKDLLLPSTVSSGLRAGQVLVPRNESPWETYSKVYKCELAGPVTVVERRVRPSTVLAMRAFPNKATEKLLDEFNRIRHDNVIAALEFFQAEDRLYVVFEHLPISLDHLVASKKWLNEIQVASVMGQIIDGLLHLAANSLEHGSLSCSGILVGHNGSVKIAKLECCRACPPNLPREQDIRALGVVAMELMEKDAKEDGAVGVHDLRLWPSDSDAVGFLSATTSTNSLDELKEHPLFTRHHWSKVYLVGLVSFALISTRTFYSIED